MSDKKNDLTQLHHIPAFEHEDDSEIDEFFAKLNETPESDKARDKDQKSTEAESGADDAPPPFGDEPPSFEDASSEDIAPPSFEVESSESVFGNDETSSFENTDAPSFGDSETAPSFGDEINFEDNIESSPSFETESEQTPVDLVMAEEPTDSGSVGPGKLPLNEMVEETYQDQAAENELEVASANDQEFKHERNNEIPAQDTTPATAKENFEEIKEFASHMSYGDVSTGGNPPFSIVLKNIQYSEDAEDLLIILKEHGVMKPDNEEAFRKSLARGILLISHISEYSAIFLCHKFRRFNLDVLMGLSDDIHPPKISEETPNRGLINKKGIKQNQIDHFNIDHDKLDLKKIIVTTTNMIESHEIKRYIGVASEHFILDASSFMVDSEKNEQDENGLISATLRRIRRVKDLTKDMNLEIKESKPTVKELYDQLGDKIKIQVLKMGGNAMVGIQYQMQTLSAPEYQAEQKYKLTCTGTVVWASRI